MILFATVVVVAARPHGGDSMLYREFNMKPPKFDGVMDPIDTMRWVLDVDG